MYVSTVGGSEEYVSVGDEIPILQELHKSKAYDTADHKLL
jgi:hypothetical protein